jgi:hypothetical protein
MKKWQVLSWSFSMEATCVNFFISSKTWGFPDPESPKSLDPWPDSLKKGSEAQLCAWTVHEATIPPIPLILWWL